MALHELSDVDRPNDELLFDKELNTIDYSPDENLSTPIANGIPISTDHFLQPASQSSPELHYQKDSLHKSRTIAISEKFNQNEFHAFESPHTVSLSAFQSMNQKTHASNETRTIHTRRPNKSSSLDVFEASFENTFPTSFSSSFEEPPPLSIAFDVPEFNDPFFLGPLNLGDETGGNAFGELKKPSGSSKGKQNSSENATLKESVPVLHDDFPSRHNITTEPDIGIALEQKSAQQVSDAIDEDFKNSNFENSHSTSLDLFPPSTLDVFDFANVVSKPKYERKISQNSAMNNRESSQLRPQKKIVSNLGRSCNEFDLEDAIKINEKETDTHTTDGDDIHVQDHYDSDLEQIDLSKSQLIRKLNQRKKTEEATKETNGVIIPSQSDTSTYHIHKRKSENSQFNHLREKAGNRSVQSNKKNSPTSYRGKKAQQIHDVNRSTFERSKKPQILSGVGLSTHNNTVELTSKTLGPLNGANHKNFNKRNVRQPIPYTEQSLSAKLRKGDIFLSKKTTTREVNENRQIVSGEKKEIGSYDDILKDLASSNIHNDT